MIMPRNMPPDAYMDDPAETIDRADHAESEEKLRSALASGALTCIGEWITRGRGGVTNRAFRADIVLLSISPQFLPCDYPNAAWVGSMAFRVSGPVNFGGNSPNTSPLTSSLRGSAFSTSAMAHKSDGAGCGRGQRGRSPARSRAHSPTTRPAAVPQARRRY